MVAAVQVSLHVWSQSYCGPGAWREDVGRDTGDESDVAGRNGRKTRCLRVLRVAKIVRGYYVAAAVTNGGQSWTTEIGGDGRQIITGGDANCRTVISFENGDSETTSHLHFITNAYRASARIFDVRELKAEE